MTLDEVMEDVDCHAKACLDRSDGDPVSTQVTRERVRAAIEQYARGDAAPVAWIQPDHLQKARVYPFLCRVEPTQRMADFVPVFTRPSRPLTDEQIESIRRQCVGVCSGEVYSSMFARAIERAHGITAQVK